jgi:hypothetical protein
MNIIKFKTDNVFLTIQESLAGSKSNDGCPLISIFFSIEDLAGNIYERELTIESLEAMSPIFRLDPLIVKELIKIKPYTILGKDLVVCKYDFEIFHRMQKIEVVVPAKIYPANSNVETLELKRTIQSLDTKLKMVELVVGKLFSFSFVESNPWPSDKSKISIFGKSFLDAVDYLKLPCSDSGKTFYHHAMSQGWFIEEVQPSFTDINSLDYEGRTALHVFFDYDIFDRYSGNRFDLACKLISAGNDCNIVDKGNHTCLWKLFVTQSGRLCKNTGDYLERSKKFLEILQLMLKHGANPNLGVYQKTQRETLLQYWQKMTNIEVIHHDVIKLLIEHGAK